MTDAYPHIETGKAAPANPPRLLDVVREKVRALHYSRRTKEAYIHWIRDYVRFHGKRHPREMGAAEVEAFLSHLANARNVSASPRKAIGYSRIAPHELPKGRQWNRESRTGKGQKKTGAPNRTPRLP